MVFGIITAIAACPAIVGTNEAVMQGQKQNDRERHRGLKSNLVVNREVSSHHAGEVNGTPVVLQNNKLYLAAPGIEDEDDHPFAGYFLPYPDHNWGRLGEGLVSTISDDPPQLNWLYVDEDTYEVKYGDRLESHEHIIGPWDCTSFDRRITLEGWEGFMAVREAKGNWALYFDREDNGLNGRVSPKKRKVEVELSRKEMKKRKGKTNHGRSTPVDEGGESGAEENKEKQKNEVERGNEEEKEEMKKRKRTRKRNTGPNRNGQPWRTLINSLQF